MGMSPFELYVVIAPIAAAFSGFGSLASGLGQRSGGDHARVDAMRLSSMLAASLSATLLALMPATFASFVDEPLAIRGSSLLAVIAVIALAPISAGRALKIRGLPGFSIAGAIANTACTLIALAAFAACLLGVLPNRLDALYLLGLMGLLGSSVVMFSRVIASMLRPHNQSKP